MAIKMQNIKICWNLKLLFFICFNLVNANNLIFEPIKQPIMGPLSMDFLLQIKSIFNPNVFVETGTFLGLSTINAANVFDKIHTIELSKTIFAKTKKNLSKYNNIQFHCGDSGEILKSILESEKQNKIVFWLDGHYSGLHFNKMTAKGKDWTPIIRELKQIRDAKIKEAIILIDDIRLFDLDIKKLPKKLVEICQGYPSLKEIFTLLYSIDPDFEIVIMGDSLMAFKKTYNVNVSNLLRAFSDSIINKDISKIDFQKVLSDVKPEELHSIKQFSKTFFHQGIGNYFGLWDAMLLIKQKKIGAAKQILLKLKKNEFFAPYVSNCLEEVKKNLKYNQA